MAAPRSLTDVSIAPPSLEEILGVLTLSAGFNSAVVVIGATCLGIAAGIIGTFTLLRKRALMGDALAHAALPGLGAAFLIAYTLGFEGRTLPILLCGATVSGVLGVITVQLLVRHTRLSEDSAIGIVLSVFFGAGVVLLSIVQTLGSGSEGGLHHFIYGQTAAMNRQDALLTASVALAALVTAILLLKEFRLVCFDHQFAAVQGWPITWIDLVMMSLVVIVTVVGLQAVGLILIVALLIIPAAAARFWSERLTVVVASSAIIGGLSGYLGSSLSALMPRLPAGAVIVLTAGAFFIISLLFAPQRGVVATALRNQALQARIAKDHLLRTMYELIEIERERGQTSESISLSTIYATREWSRWWLVLTSIWLQLRGFLTRTKGLLSLTHRGQLEATRITRNHRLWEEYLVQYAHLPLTHVDRSADAVEHVLSEKIINELEQELRQRGELPEADEPTPSVHPLATTSA